MATRAIALGANIQTAVTAGAAGDTYTFAPGIYYGQTWTPKQGDIYIGDPGGLTVLSGASKIRTAQWTNVSANWYRATQGSKDLQATVTMTIASPCVVTWTGSTFVDGQPIAITTTGALPTGLTAGTTYYAKSPSGATFNIAATAGGTAINTTGSQSGTHTGNAAGGGIATLAAPRALGIITGSISDAAAGTCTISNASPAVVTFTQTYGAGRAVTFTTTGTLPAGISPNTIYYTHATITGSAFSIANPLGGLINTTSAGSGTHTVHSPVLTVASIISGAIVAPGGPGASVYGNGVSPDTILTTNISGSGVGSTWSVGTTAPQTRATTTLAICDQVWENAGGTGYPIFDPLVYTGEELWVDNVKYTRVQAAATPAAPAGGTWYWDYTNSTVNINLASPGSHVIEYTQIPNIISSTLLFISFQALTLEKCSGWNQSAVQSATYGGFTLTNCNVCKNKGYGVTVASSGTLQIWGGTYNDNGQCGITGTPTKGYVRGAEVARNNNYAGKQSYTAWNSAGIKFTTSKDCLVSNNYVHDNGGPGIWNDIYSLRTVICDNLVVGNLGSGIMDEISSYSRIFSNRSFNNGLDPFAGNNGIYISNASNVEVYDNDIVVANYGLAGGIVSWTDARSDETQPTTARATFTASVTGATMTSSATTGTIVAGMNVYGAGFQLGTTIVGGSGTTWTLNFTQPALSGVAAVGVVENSGVLMQCTDIQVHHNRITYRTTPTGGLAGDGIGFNEAIVGGSTNYWDYNIYYTPNNTSQFWHFTTDAPVNTNYTWATLQASAFAWDKHSTNVVGVGPGLMTPPNQSPYLRAMEGPVVQVPLDISTVTTGGTAVTALGAGKATAGGKIQNPPSAFVSLGVNQVGTASGTASNGSTFFYPPGATCWLIPSASAVSVISSDSAHPFAGEGWT